METLDAVINDTSISSENDTQTESQSWCGKQDDHPLVRDRAILPTYALEAFVAQLQCWLESRISGAMVTGHSRVGKTSALRFVLNHLNDLLGVKIPLAVMNAWKGTPSTLTENRFYTELLRALGYATPHSGNGVVKKSRIVDFIASEVQAAKEHRFLLLIDEAQKIEPVQLEYLMDIYNELKYMDIQLVTIMVGTPALKTMKTELINEQQTFLLSRFMSGSFHFQGVDSQINLKRICKSLDEQSEYPEGSGISYTAHFVPIAFNNGWRLEDQSELIWRVFHLVIAQEHLPKLKEIPMNSIMAAMTMILLQLSKQDHGALVLEREFVEQMIYRTAISSLEEFASQFPAK